MREVISLEVPPEEELGASDDKEAVADKAVYLYICGGLGTGGGGAEEEDDDEDEDRWAVDKRLAITRTALEMTDAAVDVVEDDEECEGPEYDDAWAELALFCSSTDFLSAVAVGGGVRSDFFSGSRSTT
jgi:hypothetical protein